TVARRIPWFHERMRQGLWPRPDSNELHRMRDRTLGVVGVGRIGSGVAARGRGVGLRVIGADPNLSDDELRPRGVDPRRIEDLFAEADYISIHVPLSPATRHLVSRDLLGRMKPSAFLVNTSRGPIVDQAALIDILREKKIAGAGLDVFDEE